ncbi:MAG: protein translocase subunit SecF [Hyphomonadaceae bacterium]
MWPLIRLLPKKTNFKYVRFAPAFGLLSVLLVLGSFVSVFTGGFRENPVAIYQAAEGEPLARLGAVLERGFNLGIDFKGGTLIEFSAPMPVDLERVRETVSALDLGDVQVQSFGEPTQALVRFESPEGANAEQILQDVQARLSATVDSINFQRVEVVGPKVSGELFASGLIALSLAILLMLVYIWFRFEWQFGLGGVVALFHDVILTLGLFSVFRIEFTLTIIAALLTIIGYSMNDTVVVFDRIRENLRKYKKVPLGEVIDLSLNETLSRTIITGCTALLALAGLLYFGGESLAGFAIAMIFGIIIGTYSSLYVAAPAILIWGVKRGEGESRPDAAKTSADLAGDSP